MNDIYKEPEFLELIEKVRKLPPERRKALIEYIESLTKEFYTLNDIAELLGLNWRTVQRYVKDGRIKAIKVGRQWRIPAEEYARIKKEGV
ncbi:MAG: helix-turn-helix domain-containing protein [Candidatus Hodarchaeales archaeon]